MLKWDVSNINFQAQKLAGHSKEKCKKFKNGQQSQMTKERCNGWKKYGGMMVVHHYSVKCVS